MSASIHHLEFQKMLENTSGEQLDDKTRNDLGRAFTPQGTCPVARSVNFVLVVSQLLRGISPQQVSETLFKEKKEYIAPYVIRDYLTKNIPPTLMRSHFIMKWLAKSGPVNEVEVLEGIMRIQYMRVLERVDQPLFDDEDRESRRRDIQLLGKLAESSLKAKMLAGQIKLPVQPHEVHHTGATTQKVDVNVRASGETLDPRVAAKVLKTLNSIGSVQHILGDSDGEEPN